MGADVDAPSPYPLEDLPLNIVFLDASVTILNDLHILQERRVDIILCDSREQPTITWRRAWCRACRWALPPLGKNIPFRDRAPVHRHVRHGDSQCTTNKILPSSTGVVKPILQPRHPGRADRADEGTPSTGPPARTIRPRIAISDHDCPSSSRAAWA